MNNNNIKIIKLILAYIACVIYTPFYLILVAIGTALTITAVGACGVTLVGLMFACIPASMFIGYINGLTNVYTKIMNIGRTSAE